MTDAPAEASRCSFQRDGNAVGLGSTRYAAIGSRWQEQQMVQFAVARPSDERVRARRIIREAFERRAVDLVIERDHLVGRRCALSCVSRVSTVAPVYSDRGR